MSLLRSTRNRRVRHAAMVRTAKIEAPSACWTKNVPASSTNCTVPRLAQIPGTVRRATSASRWIARSATSPSCWSLDGTSRSIGKWRGKLELAPRGWKKSPLLPRGYLDALQRVVRYRQLHALGLARGQIVGVVDLAGRLIEPCDGDIVAWGHSVDEKIPVLVGIGEFVGLGPAVRRVGNQQHARAGGHNIGISRRHGPSQYF